MEQNKKQNVQEKQPLVEDEILPQKQSQAVQVGIRADQQDSASRLQDNAEKSTQEKSEPQAAKEQVAHEKQPFAQKDATSQRQNQDIQNNPEKKSEKSRRLLTADEIKENDRVKQI